MVLPATRRGNRGVPPRGRRWRTDPAIRPGDPPAGGSAPRSGRCPPAGRRRFSAPEAGLPRRLPILRQLFRLRDLRGRHPGCDQRKVARRAPALVGVVRREPRRSEVEPLPGLDQVLRHAFPLLVQRAEMVLGDRVALIAALRAIGRPRPRSASRRVREVHHAQLCSAIASPWSAALRYHAAASAGPAARPRPGCTATRACSGRRHCPVRPAGEGGSPPSRNRAARMRPGLRRDPPGGRPRRRRHAGGDQADGQCPEEPGGRAMCCRRHPRGAARRGAAGVIPPGPGRARAGPGGPSSIRGGGTPACPARRSAAPAAPASIRTVSGSARW